MLWVWWVLISCSRLSFSPPSSLNIYLSRLQLATSSQVASPRAPSMCVQSSSSNVSSRSLWHSSNSSSIIAGKLTRHETCKYSCNLLSGIYTTQLVSLYDLGRSSDSWKAISGGQNSVSCRRRVPPAKKLLLNDTKFSSAFSRQMEIACEYQKISRQ